MEESLIKLAKIHKLDILILFGSRAKGLVRNSSDYDLAFFRKKKN